MYLGHNFQQNANLVNTLTSDQARRSRQWATVAAMLLFEAKQRGSGAVRQHGAAESGAAEQHGAAEQRRKTFRVAAIAAIRLRLAAVLSVRSRAAL